MRETLLSVTPYCTSLTEGCRFYDLASLPEFVPELREEIRQALADNDGVFTSNALQSMKKMDSLLKESLRVRPLSIGSLPFQLLHPITCSSKPGSFQRKVLQPFTLSTGQVIPAGVIIEVPAGVVNADPEVFPNPAEFDPLRFYKLRQQAKEAGSAEGGASNQFVSVSQKGLTFGYGRHACPGRFFAANEIKMIVANTILRYDVGLDMGHTERYANLEFSSMVSLCCLEMCL